jgi:hypothetical protein
MQAQLCAPIFIVPEFYCEEHRELAMSAGLTFGQYAREVPTRSGTSINAFLVSAPAGWREIVDNAGTGERDGIYLVDAKGRRRVRHGDENTWHNPKAEMLTRFDIQEWFPGDGKGFHYVRKTMGGEDNIFRYHYIARENVEQRVPFRAEYVGVGNGGDAQLKCKEWLEKHYPDWRNPLAYWDD